MTVATVGSNAFSAGEPVYIYLGTVLTGTLLLTTAVASSAGALHTSVPVPQVAPGKYTLTAYGLRSTTTLYTYVTICPVLRASATSGTAGTLVSMSGVGYLPNEPITIYAGFTSLASPGTPVATVFANVTGAFAWAAFDIPGPSGQTKVAGVGQSSGAYFWFVFTVAPSLTITPFVGPPGQALVASGTGYSPTMQLYMYFGSVKTPLVPTSTTDATGAFGPLTVSVPVTTAPKSAAYSVLAAAWKKAPISPMGTAWFTVVSPTAPSLAIQANSSTPGGSPGGPLTVGGYGWPAGDTVSLWWGNSRGPTSTVPLTTASVNASSAFATQMPLGTVAQGAWFVWAVDGSLRASAQYHITYAPHMGLARIVGAFGVQHMLSIPSGGGFAPGEPVLVFVKPPVGMTITKGTITAGSMGDIGSQNLAFTLPATSATGTYVVSGRGLWSNAQANATYSIQVLSPSLTLNPTMGQPPQSNPPTLGTTIAAGGSGFAANEFVYILFDTNLAGTGYVTVAQTVARQAPRSTSVNYATTFQVPPCAGQTADVYALGGTSGATAHASLRLIIPTMGVTPATGNPGTFVVITGASFVPGISVAVRWLGPSGVVTLTQVTAEFQWKRRADAAAAGGRAAGRHEQRRHLPVPVGRHGWLGRDRAVRRAVRRGRVLAVRGAGWPARAGDGHRIWAFESVSLAVRNQQGAVLTASSALADVSGSLTVTVPLPAALVGPGVYTIALTGATTGLSASAPYTILTPAIAPTPASGDAGSTATLTGSSFAPGETVTVTWNSGPVLFVTSAGDDGSFGVQFTVPVTSAPHSNATITAVGSVSNAPAQALFLVANPAPTATPGGYADRHAHAIRGCADLDQHAGQHAQQHAHARRYADRYVHPHGHAGRHVHANPHAGQHADIHQHTGEHPHIHQHTGEHADVHEHTDGHADVHEHSGEHADVHEHTNGHTHIHQHARGHGHLHEHAGEHGHVHEYAGEHGHVHEHTGEHADVHEHTGEHGHVHEHTGGYTHIHQHTGGYTHIHQHTGGYTHVHQHAGEHADVHEHTDGHGHVHEHTGEHADVHEHAGEHADIHEYAG